MDIATYTRRVQNAFGDKYEIQLTKQDIIDALNEAQRYVTRETHCLSATATAAANTFPIIIADLMLIDRATYGGRLLDFTQEEAIDGWYTTPQIGVPMVYYLKTNKIHLWPTPLASDTTSVAVTYVPEPTQYTTITATNTILQVPIPYHDDMVMLALVRAHEMNENYRAAELKMTEFQNNVSHRRYEQQVGKDQAYQIPPSYHDYVEFDASL